LEWARIEQAVAQRCRSDGARRRGLSLASTHEETLALLDQTRELMGLLSSGEPAPLEGLRDVQAHLARIERQGVVEASALHEVRLMLERARSLRGFLSTRRERLPALWAVCAIDPKLSDLEETLDHALEPDGTLSDRASPELRRLRVEIGNLRERIVSRLSELIEKVSVLLSDRYYTLREGRYVLPVRRDAHERVVGIVHGTSQSGASVFVEPRGIVAHGNRLKMAEAELEREEWRILSGLCEAVREQMPSVHAAVETLERIDVQNACARFGQEHGGTVPELSAQPIVELTRARHPGLVLNGVQVIARCS
jgi:DNA mismatch repair protein MutS2